MTPPERSLLIITVVLSAALVTSSGAKAPLVTSAPSSTSSDRPAPAVKGRPLMSAEKELDAARSAIRRAARRQGDHGRGKEANASTSNGWFDTRVDRSLLASVYRNPAAFHR
jgi:hypothetical protein